MTPPVARKISYQIYGSSYLSYAGLIGYPQPCGFQRTGGVTPLYDPPPTKTKEGATTPRGSNSTPQHLYDPAKPTKHPPTSNHTHKHPLTTLWE